MKTDVIKVSSRGAKIEQALSQVDKLAVYKELSPRDALQLRLLTEETMCLVRAITGQSEGEFWICDTDGIYEIHLRVNTFTDSEERERLISVSTSGKNEAAKGILGKLRMFFEPDPDVNVFYTGLHTGMSPNTLSPIYGDFAWSIKEYRDEIDTYRQQNIEGSQEAWDELEKSVLAHVADDVKVSIKGNTVEMTIIKRLG